MPTFFLLLARCIAQGQVEMAVGMAVEARRLDRLRGVIEVTEEDQAALIVYGLNLVSQTVVQRTFRDEVRGGGREGEEGPLWLGVWSCGG